MPRWVQLLLFVLFLTGSLARLPRRAPLDLIEALDPRVELDPRLMDARELRALPGVGETLARAITTTRDDPSTKGTLTWEDVPGIGEVRARRIRELLRARGITPDPLRLAEGADPGSYPPAMVSTLRSLTLATLLCLSSCGGTAREDPRPDSAPSTIEAADSKTDTEPTDTTTESAHARQLVLDDGTLFTLESGPAGGSPVLLLHGARFTSRTWLELGTLSALAVAGCHAVALDWPGYGSTPAWNTEPDPALLLEHVLDRLGWSAATLVAPSMSGRFAFDLLEHSPERITTLLAIAPAGSDSRTPPGSWKGKLVLLWGELDEVVPLASARALAGRFPGARLDVLAGASHPCYLDQPDRFHALLLELLAPSLGRGR